VLRELRNRVRGIFGTGGGDDAAVAAVSARIDRYGRIRSLGVDRLYVVQQGERGVVLRFGAKTEITEAGLHCACRIPSSASKRSTFKPCHSSVSVIARIAQRRQGQGTKEALMLTVT